MDKVKKSLENIQTRNDVANMLEIKESILRFYLYGLEESEKYRDFLIRKWNGSDRTISAPDSRIRLLQKRLLEIIEEVYEPKKTVYGFVKGKSIFDNASNHVNKKWILNIDLKDFFSQIHFGRVMGALKSKPFSVGEQAALVMAQIICHNGSLPQGGCTSPIITNIVCRSLDNGLLAFAKKYHLVYTRYADDISFSTSNRIFPKEAAVIINGRCVLGVELLRIIEKNSFVVNERKTTLRSVSQRQEVTGLVVNRQINVRREYIKELRVMLFSSRMDGLFLSAVKYTESKHVIKSQIHSIILKPNITDNEREIVEKWYRRVLKGKIEFLKSVLGELNSYFIKYATEFNELVGEEVFLVEKTKSFRDYLSDNIFIIEGEVDNDTVRQGTGFLLKGIGLVTAYHVVDNENIFYTVYKQNGDRVNSISLGLNCLKYDKNKDYALFNGFDTTNGLELEQEELSLDQRVHIYGFPNYSKGNSLFHVETNTSSFRKMNGINQYSVTHHIYHGTSGGPVLSENGRVVGFVEGGPNSSNEEDLETMSGIISIREIEID